MTFLRPQKSSSTQNLTVRQTPALKEHTQFAKQVPRWPRDGTMTLQQQ